MITINIPSQLPALTGNSLLYLRVNLAENGIEWAATAGGNITIGSTAIASGTVNRILFEGAGNVVQQDSAFVWNNTNKRLILGTEAVADTNSRLVVIGKGTGTNTTFAVHNSTGTNKSLVVRDDGRVGVGTTSLDGMLTVQQNNSGNVYIGKNSFGDTRFSVEVGNGTVTIDRTNGFAAGAVNGLYIGNASVSIGRLSNDMRVQVTTSLTNGMKMINANSAYMLGLFAQRNDIGEGSRQRGIANIQSTFAQNLYGFPFNFFIEQSPTSQTPNQEEAFRFWSYRGLNGAGTTNTKRLFIGNGETVAQSGFVNSRVGITDNSSITVDNNALLDLQSTTKGFLPPRMTGAQAEAITSPAEGLMIYATNAGSGDITSKGWWGFNGTNWVQLN